MGNQFTAQASGSVIGGVVGYNWQKGDIVLGVEGELGWLGASGIGASAIGDAHVSSDSGLFASVRARAGMAFGGTLA